MDPQALYYVSQPRRWIDTYAVDESPEVLFQNKWKKRTGGEPADPGFEQCDSEHSPAWPYYCYILSVNLSTYVCKFNSKDCLNETTSILN